MCESSSLQILTKTGGLSWPHPTMVLIVRSLHVVSFAQSHSRQVAHPPCVLPPSRRDWTLTMNSQGLWHETKTRPPQVHHCPAWLKGRFKSTTQRKHSSPSRIHRNEARRKNWEETLTLKQRERVRIMSRAFNDPEASEKIALDDSSLLQVYKGDVLMGQGGRYLHPRLFKPT